MTPCDLSCDLHVTTLFLRDDVTVATSDLCRALTALEGTSQESKILRILSVLDEDHDGVISLEDLTEVWGRVWGREGVAAGGVEENGIGWKGMKGVGWGK